MNGPHDVGGRHGFGRIEIEPNEPIFHAPWERLTLGLVVAAGAAGEWTLDESRFARENRPAGDYYNMSYYQIWLAALERLVVEKGMVTQREIREGHAVDTTVAPRAKLLASDVQAFLSQGRPVDRDPGEAQPMFAPGRRVRTRNLQPRGHTRLPAYARDKVGQIESVLGYHIFADTSATGDRQTAQWLYTVVFEAKTLWGEGAQAADTVSIDAWESYLEPA